MALSHAGSLRLVTVSAQQQNLLLSPLSRKISVASTQDLGELSPLAPPARTFEFPTVSKDEEAHAEVEEVVGLDALERSSMPDSFSEEIFSPVASTHVQAGAPKIGAESSVTTDEVRTADGGTGGTDSGLSESGLLDSPDARSTLEQSLQHSCVRLDLSPRQSVEELPPTPQLPGAAAPFQPSLPPWSLDAEACGPEPNF